MHENEALARFYAEAGYGASAGAHDTVVVATDGASVVGAVRLCREEGIMVLRGMQVARRYQGQGIGSQLLAACTPCVAGTNVFCLPHTHLEMFYARAGYARIPDAYLPPVLAWRLAAYRARGLDVIAMRRPAA